MRHAVLASCLIGASMGMLAGSGWAETGTQGPMSKVPDLEPKGRYRAWIFLTQKPDLPRPEDVSPRALERRSKVGIADRDSLDLPVTQTFWKKIENTGVKIRTVSRWFNAVSVEATGEQLKKIANWPFVLRISPVRSSRKAPEPVRPAPAPAPSFAQPSGETAGTTKPPGGLDYGLAREQLEQIGVPEAHARGLTGQGVVVALLDDGCMLSHEVFRKAQIRAQWDFVNQDGSVQRDPDNPNDYDDGHGTSTLSVLGGYAPGRLAGPAFGATFLVARTEDGRKETPAEEDYWIAGLEWAEQLGADIVSSSLGYREFDNSEFNHSYSTLDGQTLLISRAANIAAERGLLIVNSVGNEGEQGAGSLVAPADAYGVLSIGAVNRTGDLAEFSSRGPTADGRIKPELVARGFLAYVATNEGYGFADGTSFSAPLVAGAAALLLEAHRDWTPNQVREAFIRTASRAGRPDNDYGFGVVRLARAIEYSAPIAPLAMLDR